MAKGFAKKFYASKKWHDCRNAYIEERRLIDGGMCEDCHESPGEELHHIQELTVANITDPMVALGHDNLVWLCRDCHFKRHRELIMQAFSKGRRGRVLNDAGYYFNAEGELQRTKTVIVWGSPASGKTTYVLDHMETGDLVVDLDSIKQAISAQKKRNTPENLSKVAIGITEYLYGLIEHGEVDCQTKWVIASLPDRKEREELARRLKAELIYMDATYHECLRRVEDDSDRGDKVQQKYFVDKWWERFEG